MDTVPHEFVPDLNSDAIERYILDNMDVIMDMTDEIGSGTFGEVFIGVTKTRQNVAVKITRLENTDEAAFRMEVMMQKHANSRVKVAPEILSARLLEVQRNPSGVREIIGIVVMEPGGPDIPSVLENIYVKIKTRRPASKQKILQFLEAVYSEAIRLTRALEHVGLMHLDLHGGNLLMKDSTARADVWNSNPSQKLYVIDFGFAQRFNLTTGARVHQLSGPATLMRNLKRFVPNYDLATFTFVHQVETRKFSNSRPGYDLFMQTFRLEPVIAKYGVKHLWYKSVKITPPPNYAQIVPDIIVPSDFGLTADDVDHVPFLAGIPFAMKDILSDYIYHLKTPTNGNQRVFELLSKGDFIYERCLDFVAPVYVHHPRVRRGLVALLVLASRLFYVPPINPATWLSVDPQPTLPY